MKRFLAFFLILTVFTLTHSSLLAEPPYHRPNNFKIPNSTQSQSGLSVSNAIVDSSFSISAEWIGTPQWMTGVDNGLEAFNGSIARGPNLFGSNATPSQYGLIEIRLDANSNNWSNAIIYRRDNIGARFYDSYQVGIFPGSAWDVSDPFNPRRLNVCFVEWDDGQGENPPVNGTWDPDTSANGKYEYLFVMHSSYDSSGLFYENTNILYDTLDLLYTWCPRVADGHTFFESDTGKIVITPKIGLFADESNTSIYLYWLYPGSEPFRYRIFYTDSAEGTPDQLLAQLAPNAIGYTHQNLLPNQDYTYQIFSYDRNDNMIFSSNTISARTREVTIEIDLMAQWNLRSNYGDICGYTDSATGIEYALLCARSQGVSIIDITDSPMVEAGFITGSFSSSDVKDVRIYSHYAVVICETAPTQIFDIADVTNPVFVSTITGGRHNGMVDGHFVYLVGGSFGGLEIFSIEDPFNPAYVGEFDPFYYHDVAIRNDTLAACGINGNGIDLIDVADKSNAQLLARFNYPESGPHNAAFSENGRYLFIGDEIGAENHTRVFDISDLNDIQKVFDIIVHPGATAHNCYVKGNHLYIAHYAEGLRVWNIKDPTNPYEVAFYDTHPNEYAGYIGAWGVWPYFESGKIIISDMQFGLFTFNSVVTETECCIGTRGNVNYDEEEIDILDLVFVVDMIFRQGPLPECPEEADVNADGKLTNIHDLIYLINFIFRSGPIPPDCP